MNGQRRVPLYVSAGVLLMKAAAADAQPTCSFAPTSVSEPVPYCALDRKPTLAIRAEAPRYPARLRAVRLDGTVELTFRVSESGGVDTSSVLVLASTHDMFTSSVRAALAGWRFEAGIRAGRAVSTVVPVRVAFVLDENPFPLREVQRSVSASDGVVVRVSRVRIERDSSATLPERRIVDSLKAIMLTEVVTKVVSRDVGSRTHCVEWSTLDSLARPSAENMVVMRRRVPELLLRSDCPPSFSGPNMWGSAPPPPGYLNPHIVQFRETTPWTSTLFLVSVWTKVGSSGDLITCEARKDDPSPGWTVHCLWGGRWRSGDE